MRKYWKGWALWLCALAWVWMLLLVGQSELAVCLAFSAGAVFGAVLFQPCIDFWQRRCEENS